jgi:hypothetical protein
MSCGMLTRDRSVVYSFVLKSIESDFEVDSIYTDFFKAFNRE